MKDRRVRRMFTLALCLAALAAPFHSRSQETPAPSVIKVLVLVDGYQVSGPLAGLVPITAGDVYSRAVVDQAVKAVYRTGLFSDVRVEKSGEEEVVLTFRLTRNLIVRKLRFKGPRVAASRLIEGLETLRPGSVFHEDLLPRAVDEVEEALKREGFFDAGVQAATRPLRGSVRIDIEFTISAWKRFRIASLDLEGPLVVTRDSLVGRMKSRVGKPYVPAQLDKDIQTLTQRYASLGYPRADILPLPARFHEDMGTVDIGLDVQPHEKIVILIKGANVPAKLVAPLWQERIFDEWGLSEGEARVLTYLRKKGYILATVKGRIERPENELDIVYDVDPGRRFKINGISFEGNTTFTSRALKADLAVSERVLFFSSISYDRLFALPGEIEFFYQTHGFPDVRAELALKERGEGVDAVLRISEGRHQEVQSVVLEGAHLFPDSDILKGLIDTAGGPLFQPNVQRDVGIIETYYLNHGVRGTQVSFRVEPAGENLFRLVFEIEEGRPVTIRNILITGNRVTKTSVIRREIEVREGGPADLGRIQDSRRRLERLGIFSDVRTDEVLTAPNEENLIVTVQEGELNYVGAGLGVETQDEGSLALWDNLYSPRVTAEYIRSNVFGAASQLSLVGQYSQVERRAIVSWTQPYLVGMALQPSLLGWIEHEDRTSFTFDRHGVNFTLSRPVGRALLLISTFSWSRTELTDLEIEESEIDRRLQPYATALGSLSLVWDRRDDTLNPSRGSFLSITGQLAAPLFGTESDYWKTFVKFQYFRPVLRQLLFGLTARLGLCEGLIAVPERFFAGGSSSFRGERFDNLGPKDPETGKPVGGRALILINAEMEFPLLRSFKALSGVGFLDLGNVFSHVSDIRPGDLEAALGLGIRYRTPLGPLRLEMAWKLGAPERRGRPLVFFTIGNVF